MCLLSLASTAKEIILWIWDRLDKLKDANNIVARLLTFIERMQNELEKVAKDLDSDGEPGDKIRAETYVDGFLVHLQKVKSRLETSELDRNKKGVANKAKKLFKSPTTVNDLRDIEDELKLAMDELKLFIDLIALKLGHNNAHVLNKLSEASQEEQALQQNDLGIEYPPDPTVKHPSAPRELTIVEAKNKFILTWKPCGEDIDKYELCYHESKNRTCFIDGTKSSVTIGAPKVLPCPTNLLYTMKIRGIRDDIKGEWSNTVVGQFTKPLPQLPTLQKLLLRSTIAELTIAKPATICSTESPVTYYQVGYIQDTSSEWKYEEFAVEPDDSIQILYIYGLESKRRYTFKVKAMNAEGWGEFSNEISSITNKLPPRLSKPLPPLIEALSCSKVKVTVESPEGATVITPVILWEVIATYYDCSAYEKVLRKIFVPDYTKERTSFHLANLTPDQQYDFKVVAKNELGWSPPSDTVLAFTGPPSPPKIRPSSLKSPELIKIRWEPCIKYTKPSYYEISKATKGGKGKELEVQHKIPGDKSSITFISLRSNTTYYFKLRSWNGVYVSKWSKELEVKTERSSMLRRLSPRPRRAQSPLPPKVTNVENDYLYVHSSKVTVVEALKADKAAELSDYSDDEDPIIIDTAELH